jgi:lysophospholipase L1-like esterase
MNLKSVILLLASLCFLLGIIAYNLIKKSYLSYNLLRIDPLEINGFDAKQLQNSVNLKNVWMIGDSRIARWNKTLLASPDLSIKNLGAEGQTSSQVLNRLRYYLETEVPQCIILEVGINDLKTIGLKKSLYSLIEIQCYENITSIIELCLVKNIQIVLMNIFPTGNIECLRRLVWNSSVDSAITNVNNRLAQFCNLKGVFYFDTYKMLCDKDMEIKEIYQDGFLHISDSAYGVLSNYLINNNIIQNVNFLNSRKN